MLSGSENCVRTPPAALLVDPDESASRSSRATSTRAWMFTVARNLVIDEARSARRRHEIGVAETPERGSGDGTDALFESLLVEEALAGLDLEHRAVIVHAYYGGCSIAEVARRLSIPEGTVKSRLHYGLRALRLALQEKGVTR